MDLKRILDAKPEPQVIDKEHFFIDPTYQASNNYKILTPMSDFQKELTDQIVSLHYSDILKFFERSGDDKEHDELTQTNKEIILDSLHTMLNNDQLITSHPYLLIDHYFPKSLTNRDLPKRLAETSGKFQVLNDILDILDSVYNPKDKNDHSKDRYKSINVGIVAREGKTLDLVNSLCTGAKCYLKRYSGVKVRDSSAKQKAHMALNLTVHLFPSTMENLNEKELPNEEEGENLNLDFLILFDITADASNEKLRKYLNFETRVLQLVPIYSVDHIALYFRDRISERSNDDYIRRVVAAVVSMRGSVGQIPTILKPVYTSHLKYLTDWFKQPHNIDWPLPDIPDIPIFRGKDVEHSLLTEVKFNFDNKDFLKEEAESKEESKELNLNFNFGSGKTKMVSHIVQPRYCGKNEKKLDFYESKRWQKKYLTNPLNSDYYKLTGISKEIHQDEVLTHTLIYSLTMKMAALQSTNIELKMFDDTFESRMREFAVMRKEYSRMSKKAKDMQASVASKALAIEDLDSMIEKLKKELSTEKENVSKLVDSFTNEEYKSTSKKWICLDQAATECNAKIARMQRKIESNNTEMKYMKEEMLRAKKSVEESTVQFDQKQAYARQLGEKINSQRKKMSKTDSKRKQLEEAKENCDKARNKNIELRDRLDLTLKRLVEASSGRSRYVNYARGGLLG